MADVVSWIGSASGANIFAALSALFAWWAANETRNATKAQLLNGLIDEYAKQEMADHLDILATLRRSNLTGFAPQWIAEFKQKLPQAVKINLARRYVKGYFDKAARLNQSGFLDSEALRLVALRAGINVYYDVVRPLDRLLNPKDKRGILTEERLLREVGRFEDWDGIT